MLNERSKQVRRDLIALSKDNGGYHYGGSFSCVEILIALFDHVLTDDDRFILSKGHSCWPYYTLLRERGFNPKLGGHPERDPHNGIYCTTGSLGHGFPSAVGMALAKKLKGEAGRVFVLMGDGECQAGTTWESLLIASQHQLDNLVVIVDWNGIQGSDLVTNILPLSSSRLIDIAGVLGWMATKTTGHSLDSLKRVLNSPVDKPTLIVAQTVKGKGASFMEGKAEWHAKWLDPKHMEIVMGELQ